MRYAGILSRFLATLIDTIIVFVFCCTVITLLGASHFGASSIDLAIHLGDGKMKIAALPLLIGLTAILVGIFYAAFMLSSKRKATLGKMAMGIIVTDESGAPLNFGKALLREVSKIFSGMLLFIGYIMAFFTEKKQALHDYVAKTIVIKK